MSVLIGFDIETTGLQVGWCDTIQIGATCVDQRTRMPTAVKFERKLHIRHPERVEPGVLGKFNHYDPEVWAREAVDPAQGWREFCDWVFMCSGGGAVKPRFLGHNIGKFDYPNMMAWTKAYGLTVHHDYHLIDTTTVFDSFKRRAGIDRWGCKMDDICAVLEIKNPKPHDALADAMTDALGNAVMEAYLDALIDVGRGYAHAQYLDEAFLRLGVPQYRNAGHQPLARRP